MSTKTSLFYEEYTIKEVVHVYREMLDDNIYIETNEGKLKLPEAYAKELVK